MQRLNMYIAYDKGDFAKSLELAQKMMQNTDTTSLIGRDYLYYARVLGKNNMAAEALVQYENAIAKDTANVALYKEMAEVAEKANLTDQAISYYTDYIRKGGEEVKIADYFSLGQTYYIAASAFLPQDNTPLSEADIAEDDALRAGCRQPVRLCGRTGSRQLYWATSGGLAPIR